MLLYSTVQYSSSAWLGNIANKFIVVVSKFISNFLTEVKMSECSVCENEIRTNEAVIICDNCKKPLHTLCSNLSRSEIKFLKSDDRLLSFNCDACKNSKTDIISELQKVVTQLQQEIINLKNANSNVNNKDDMMEVIISEMQDRQKREANVIIYNIPESTKQIVEEKIKDDVNIVQNIITETGTDVTKIRSIKVTRIGKFTDGKERPVCVNVNDKYTALNILKNKKKVTNKNFKIFSDQTKRQRSYLLSVQNQLKELVAKGVTDKTIKYVNNIPTIVSADI